MSPVLRFIPPLALITALCVLLSACLGTLEETLENAGEEGQNQLYERDVIPETIEPIEVLPAVRASAAASLARLGFAPIAGLPDESRQIFYESLRRAAFRRNIFLVPNGDPTQSHTVKGYLSLTHNELGTVVVYIWDISANDGGAAHRVTGQLLTDYAPGGWPSIDQRTLDTLAVQSMEALIAWLNEQFEPQADTRDIIPFK